MEDGYGPLAVLPPAGGGDDASAEGTLTITDNCVYLDSMLLAWPSNWVQWDPGSRTITFDTGFDEAVVLADGMLVAVGGSTIIGDEDEGEPAVMLDPARWVEPPHETCEDTNVWGVSGARIVGDGGGDPADTGFDPREFLPDGVMATSFRPEPLVTVSGTLVTVHDRPCLAIRQPDGTEVGLVWSTEFVNWDGIGIEVPGEPARYVEAGEEIEIAGDWFDNYVGEYDELETDSCRADQSIWVAEITAGGVTG